MVDDMTQEVLAIFREEAMELLSGILTSLNRAVNATGAERSKHTSEVARLLHTLKGAASAVSAESIKEAVHTLEDQVAALPLSAPPEAFDPVFHALEAIEADFSGSSFAAPAKSEPKPLPMPVKPPEPPRFEPPKPAEAAPVVETPNDRTLRDFLRVPPQRVDQLNAHMSELVLTRLQHEQLLDRMVHLRRGASQTVAKQRELTRLLAELRTELSPESFRKLRMSTQSMTQGLSGLLSGLLSVCREGRVLQTQSTIVSQGVEEAIQGLRLMPLTPFFEGFAKTARDAARRANKQVRFEVRADGAEVDRAVLTRLQDALLHLVRNAVVHGIESPEERRRSGKAPEGSILLEASSQGTRAIVKVIDDGAGVDAVRVRQKAQALGITSSSDVLDLLTHPGLSTKDDADELAGRGVGLDVVATIIRSLDGTLEMSTVRGEGTTFTVRVPIAASTTMGLIMTVGDQAFGVLMNNVERVVRATAEDIGLVEGKPCLRIGDEMIALVPLANLLGLEAPERLGARVPAVVLQTGKRRLAVVVSEIPGEHPLVVRPLGYAFRGSDLFLGGAVQPDHSVVPVLSTAALFGRAARASLGRFSAEAFQDRATATTSYHALVVDDSITMRTMIRNVLRAAGYQVTVAEDGQQALSVLATMDACHIVITDLQMPHMDGMELCRNIRAIPGPYLPIVMVTSVDDDHEKTRALSAGADAYVVKAAFDQPTFLRRVDSLVRGPV